MEDLDGTQARRIPTECRHAGHSIRTEKDSSESKTTKTSAMSCTASYLIRPRPRWEVYGLPASRIFLWGSGENPDELLHLLVRGLALQRVGALRALSRQGRLCVDLVVVCFLFSDRTASHAPEFASQTPS